MERKSFKINLAGQEFRISSENDPEYLQELVSGVNKRIREMQAQFPEQSTSRCALIAMLNMQDELMTLRAERDRVDMKINELRTLRAPAEERVQAPVKRPFERRKPVGV